MPRSTTATPIGALSIRLSKNLLCCFRSASSPSRSSSMRLRSAISVRKASLAVGQFRRPLFDARFQLHAQRNQPAVRIGQFVLQPRIVASASASCSWKVGVFMAPRF